MLGRVALHNRFMQSPPSFSRDILARLDKNGPRYTSYPTADRYDTRFGPAQYRQALSCREQDAARGPLSMYAIGRAHVRTTVTHAHLVCRLLLEKKNTSMNDRTSNTHQMTTTT